MRPPQGGRCEKDRVRVRVRAHPCVCRQPRCPEGSSSAWLLGRGLSPPLQSLIPTHSEPPALLPVTAGGPSTGCRLLLISHLMSMPGELYSGQPAPYRASELGPPLLTCHPGPTSSWPHSVCWPQAGALLVGDRSRARSPRAARLLEALLPVVGLC